MIKFPFNLTKHRQEFLEKLGLETPFQVINYFPRRYDDFTLTPSLDLLFNNQKIVIRGKVIIKEQLFRIRKGLTRFSFKMEYLKEEVKVVVFNRDFYYKNILDGQEILVSGKFNYYKKEVIAIDIFIKNLDNNNVRPIYSLISGVRDYDFSIIVLKCYQEELKNGHLKNIIPSELMKKYKIMDRDRAYYFAHFPRSMLQVKNAYRYLKYEEILVYSLMMQKIKTIALGNNVSSKKIDYLLVNEVLRSLPYQLTSSQEVAIKEIFNDLESKRIMYRLLQGDVGSGKTIVAIMSLIANYSAGYQGAFMAPTDILARQHYLQIKQILNKVNSDIKVELLVASLKTSQKKEIVENIASNKVNIIVGTHALIQDKILFKKLGLAIIDEQHRFGVNQRKKLREKGKDVEFLLMSATPIPRTLAISLYGDMDVSTLSDIPNKKRNVKTKVIKGKSIKPIINDVESVISNKQKVYIVCSLIEDNQTELQNVEKIYEGVRKHFLNKCPVFLLHGRLNEEEKKSIMKEFASCEAGILVATTVIEVGIDIKNASLMIIYDADRFGLAQLHQLRGRIGRNGQESKCYLLCNNDNGETLERLKFLEKNDDGFEISRYDMSLRGPGDIKGIAQSGDLNFNTCNIFTDLKIFELARNDAKEILKNSESSENKSIIKFVDEEMAKEIAVIE
ncbi:MAG: ATP-dependent DNA helicase RecG [Bacilli bacterium]|nr:ATP-dependent DNA helicase RecG [Bacilli bacterium]